MEKPYGHNAPIIWETKTLVENYGKKSINMTVSFHDLISLNTKHNKLKLNFKSLDTNENLYVFINFNSFLLFIEEFLQGRETSYVENKFQKSGETSLIRTLYLFEQDSIVTASVVFGTGYVTQDGSNIVETIEHRLTFSIPTVVFKECILCLKNYNLAKLTFLIIKNA